jgi:hypothetical protein
MLWNYPDAATALAQFSVATVKTEVSFRRHGHAWHVTFHVDGDPNAVAYSALSIFSRVFDAIFDFIALREPQTLLFGAGIPEAAEIYSTYLQRDAKRLAALGYRVDGQHRVLRRFKPSRWRANVRV